jgi:anti-anti-sigma factor
MGFEICPGEAPGVLVLEGELDVATAEQLESAAAKHPEGPMILDLERLTFMDSSGLRALLRLAVGRGDDPIVLRRPSRAVRRLLDVAIPNGVPGLRVEA